MADERNAIAHLLAGIEELLRAGADAAASLRELTRPDDTRAPGGQAFLEDLRVALRRELARWELRGDRDPAAARVRDLFEAILDVIDAPPEPAHRPRAPESRTPRRRVQR